MSITDATIAKYRGRLMAIRGRTVVYRQCSSSTDYQTGIITRTYADTTMTALTSQKRSGDSEECTFRVLLADLPTTPPSKTDRIQFRGVDWVITDYEIDQSGVMYDIHTTRA